MKITGNTSVNGIFYGRVSGNKLFVKWLKKKAV